MRWETEPYALSSRTDAAILRDVRRALYQASDLDLRSVDITVDDGEVTLDGSVPERWMQLEIEHAALHVRGVRDVVSRITSRAA